MQYACEVCAAVSDQWLCPRHRDQPRPELPALIPYGSPRETVRAGLTSDTPPHCPDCGTPIGEYHKRHCDVEQCPHCGDQRVVCDLHRRHT
jgi:hypothetical protein